MPSPTRAATAICGMCGRELPRARMLPAEAVGSDIAARLESQKPDWRATGFVCADDLLDARRARLSEEIIRERGELTALDQSVVDSITRRDTLSENVEESFEDRITFGDRLADRMANFAGSWVFVSFFGVVLFTWMAINAVPAAMTPFDPYPFILLNLVLSCIAAIQAPLIMMSQRRVEAKDRMRSENDYRVNLKAELEIRHLHEKIDHHLLRQIELLGEIRDLQFALREATPPRGRRRLRRQRPIA